MRAPAVFLESLAPNGVLAPSFLYIVIFMISIALLLTAIAWIIKIRGHKDALYNKTINDLGFAYNPEQDIFYSTMNAWQRKFGYCQLYDEAAAPLSMIVDCEPIRFEYGGKKWLIELWKGQYGMTVGGEIGVYTTEGPELDIPGFFNGTFYDRTDDEDHLQMSFKLIKDKRVLFVRKDKH